MFIEFRASPRCFRAPRRHSMFKTKRGGLRPWKAPRRPFDAIKNMPPLRHGKVMKAYPRRNIHALLASLTGNQSCSLPFLTSRKLPLRHWQIKRPCPVLHLPRNGASGIKQAGLSVRLKGRHRRGSAPMFILPRDVASCGTKATSNQVQRSPNRRSVVGSSFSEKRHILKWPRFIYS